MDINLSAVNRSFSFASQIARSRSSRWVIGCAIRSHGNLLRSCQYLGIGVLYRVCVANERQKVKL